VHEHHAGRGRRGGRLQLSSAARCASAPQRLGAPTLTRVGRLSATSRSPVGDPRGRAR
jgi:hypothetical protein